MARLSDIRLRRSAVSGSIPSTSNLNLGELALNTADGKVYMKKSVGGTDSVVEVGGANSGIASTFTAYEYTATANQTTFSGSDNYSNTLAYNTGTPPKVQVFMNGILLDEGSSADYTGTNGTSVVLTTGADAGDLVQIHAYKSDVSVSSNINLGDNKKLQFGDAQDLQIYHNGSNSYIDDVGTGALNIRSSGIYLEKFDGSEVMASFLADGAATLYHNGSPKLATTSTGVQTTGTVNVNGAYTLPTSDGSSGQALVSDGSGTLSFATVSGGAVTSMSDADGDTKIQVEESSDEDKIRFDANGAEVARMGFNSSSESTLEIVRNGVPAARGQLTFNGSGLITDVTSGYHSLIVRNGGSEHFRVRSNGNVGIGESSPDTTLHLTAANPALTLQESDTSTDFNKTEFQSSGGTLLFNTREEDGTFVSTDYAIGKNANGATIHTWSVAGSTRVQLDSSYFDIEAGGFRVDDPGNNYPFVVSPYGYMTTRSSSITQLNGTDHANVPLSILADVASTRTANYMSVGDIGSAGNKFVIDEVGNVGIGATNPALQSAGTGLHINASAHSEIKFTNSTTGAGASDGTALVATGSGFQINNREAGSILLRTSNTTAVTIDSAQNTTFAGNIITSGSISSGNITTTGYIRGPSTFTIDPAAHGDNTGTLVIAGNLQVDGTTTTINSTTLTVDDKNITLASGSTNKAAANAAGITVDCGSDTDARITYASTTDEWDINKSIHVSGAAGSGVKINSGGAIVGGGATGGDTQLMFWGGGPVYYGRSSLGGTVTGHEFRVGGATKLNVDSSGNTIASGNITATNLYVTEDIGHSGDGDTYISFDNNAHTYYAGGTRLLDFAPGSVIFNEGGGDVDFRVEGVGNANALFVQGSDANVGIGTNSPQEKLHVYTTGTSRVEAEGTTGFAAFKATNNSGSYGWYVDDSADKFHLYDFTDNADRITVDGSGNVGIGTTAPVAKLQIEVLGIETNQSSVTSTNQFECEAMSATAFRSARYTVQVTNVTDSTYQITEILLIHDGTTPSITEYGTIFTGSAAEASFDAEIANGNVRLLATPASADNMQFKVVRHSILV